MRYVLVLVWSAAELNTELTTTGSSTACIVSLNASSGQLRAAKYAFQVLSAFNADRLGSLGDSGFLVIRSANLFYLQRPQTHGFNFPRQLSKFPNTRRKDEYYVDQPGDADTVRICSSILSI
jgi:protein phosphatase PTC7